MRLLQRGQRGTDEAAWHVHEERAGGAVAAVFEACGAGKRAAAELDDGWRKRLLDNPPEVASSGLLLLVREFACRHKDWWVSGLYELPSTRWSVPREDAFLAARAVVAAPDTWQVGWAMSMIAVMVGRALGGVPVTDEEAAALGALIESLENRVNVPASDQHEARIRLLWLLPTTGEGVTFLPVAPVDGWAASVLPALRSHQHDGKQVNAFLRHLILANGSQPSAKWQATSTAFVADGRVVPVLKLMLEQLVSAEPVTRRSHWGIDAPVVVDDLNADLARAAVWAAASVAQPWVVPTLHKLA
ncbi:MAG TPA: hypothetical protein VK662_05340, partial [Acidothermaceae bacterium]|nr:hypothetical protein [Acidothermaceae bacterium]